MNAQLPLIGTWRLVTMETRSVTGRVWPGLYDDGYLLYTTDGYMCGVLTKGHRARFGTESHTSGSIDEKVRAFDSYISYGGSYSVDGEIVTHHVQFSLFPNRVGTDQVRRFALSAESDTLTIWTVNPLVIQDEETYSVLTWRRA
jgi:hypothetical protein